MCALRWASSEVEQNHGTAWQGVSWGHSGQCGWYALALQTPLIIFVPLSSFHVLLLPMASTCSPSLEVYQSGNACESTCPRRWLVDYRTKVFFIPTGIKVNSLAILQVLLWHRAEPTSCRDLFGSLSFPIVLLPFPSWLPQGRNNK